MERTRTIGVIQNMSAGINMLNRKNALIFSLGLAAATAAGGASLEAVAGLTASADSNAGASSTSASSAKFTGKNGRVSVDGDLVQARDGVLTVNGKPYGSVSEKSVVQYMVRDGERVLTVDGVPRKPAP
jgi:hypothetical protein